MDQQARAEQPHSPEIDEEFNYLEVSLPEGRIMPTLEMHQGRPNWFIRATMNHQETGRDPDNQHLPYDVRWYLPEDIARDATSIRTLEAAQEMAALTVDFPVYIENFRVGPNSRSEPLNYATFLQIYNKPDQQVATQYEAILSMFRPDALERAFQTPGTVLDKKDLVEGASIYRLEQALIQYQELVAKKVLLDSDAGILSSTPQTPETEQLAEQVEEETAEDDNILYALPEFDPITDQEFYALGRIDRQSLDRYLRTVNPSIQTEQELEFEKLDIASRAVSLSEDALLVLASVSAGRRAAILAGPDGRIDLAVATAATEVVQSTEFGALNPQLQAAARSLETGEHHNYRHDLNQTIGLMFMHEDPTLLTQDWPQRTAELLANLPADQFALLTYLDSAGRQSLLRTALRGDQATQEGLRRVRIMVLGHLSGQVEELSKRLQGLQANPTSTNADQRLQVQNQLHHAANSLTLIGNGQLKDPAEVANLNREYRRLNEEIKRIARLKR